MKLFKLFFSIAMIAFAMVACQDDSAPEEQENPEGPKTEQEGTNYNEPPMETTAHPAKAIELNASQKSVNEGLRNFSWDLFAVISRQNVDGANLIFSPLSLQVELAMLLNAANDATIPELLEAMHLSGSDVTDVNLYFSHLAKGINDADNVTRFSSSNSLWYDLRYSVAMQFDQALKEYYSCEFFPVVFGPETTNKINHWAEERTYGRIKEIIPRTTHGVDYIHLLNAVYFRSPWSEEMAENSEENFTSIDGSVSRVEMFRGNCYNLLSTSLYTATMVPFSNGAFAMFFILPADGVSFDEIYADVRSSGETFTNMKSSTKVIFTIPEFETKSDILLEEVLRSLNCDGLLNSSNMLKDFAGQGFGLKQIANITVDKDGAEAAAVTVTTDGALPGNQKPETKYLTFDRPFIYGIVECSTATPLFLGEVAKL